MGSRSSLFRVASLVVLSLAAAPASARLPVTVQKIAMSDEAAPGTAKTFSSFRAPRIRDTGEVGFLAVLSGDSFTSLGVWRWNGSALDALAVVGAPAPLFPAETFYGAADERLHPTSRGLVFGGTPTNGTTLYGRSAAGALVAVVRDGDSLPGSAGFYYGIANRPIAASAAGLAFHSVPFSTFTGGGIYRQSASDVTELVVRDTQAAPGIAGRFLCDFTAPLMNEAGSLLFTASLDADASTGCQSSSESALYGSDGVGGVAPLVKSGDTAPGTGGVFAAIGAPAVDQIYLGLDDAGRVGLAAQASGGPVSGTKWGIWGPDGAGGLRLVAFEGDAAPGVPNVPPITWTTFANVRLTLSGRGDLVFRPQADAGYTLNGIWAAPLGGVVVPVAVEGQSLADPVAGAFFSIPPYFEANGNGDVLFAGQLGVSFNDIRDGLWLGHASGGTPDLLLIKGDLIDVGGGTLRELSYIETAKTWSGGADGKGKGLTDARRMALILHFSDGSSGVFRVLVPEPASAALTGAAVISMLALAARRRP